MTTAHYWIEAGTFSLHHARGGPGGPPGDRERVHVGPTHENPGFELSWIEAGGIEFALGRNGRDGAIAGTRGMSLLLPPDLTNTPRASSGSVIERIIIAPNLLTEAADALGSNGNISFSPRVLGADSSVSAIARAITIEHTSLVTQELHSSSVDPGIDALVHALILALARRRVHATRPHDESILEPGIRRAIDRINEDLAAPIGVDDLARTAGLSRFVFLRKFRAQVGESPYRYLTLARLDRAAEKLRSTPQKSILEIALDCGFADPSRFARAFADRFGTTPRRWRS